MTRITTKDLEFLVSRINKLTNSPAESWTREDGTSKAGVNNYHLDSAYGGVKLVRMTNESGGVSLVSRNGYGTKKELYYQLDAIITGLQMKVSA